METAADLDWNPVEAEALGSNCMVMRKDIWGPLAEKYREAEFRR